MIKDSCCYLSKLASVLSGVQWFVLALGESSVSSDTIATRYIKFITGLKFGHFTFLVLSLNASAVVRLSLVQSFQH